MNKLLKTTWFFPFLVLFVMSLACNLPVVDNQTDLNSEQIPISSEAAEDLIESVENAVEQASKNEQFTLVITEAQVTSLVNIELEKVEQAPISNVQVFLRDEKIQIRGDVNQGGLSLEFTSVLSVYVDEIGRIKFNVESAKAGPFSVPQNVVDEMIANLENNFTDTFLPDSDVVIENVSIQNGEMIITGHKN